LPDVQIYLGSFSKPILSPPPFTNLKHLPHELYAKKFFDVWILLTHNSTQMGGA
jgi:hypothetical protein